jgi:hypothetical protein
MTPKSAMRQIPPELHSPGYSESKLVLEGTKEMAFPESFRINYR